MPVPLFKIRFIVVADIGVKVDVESQAKTTSALKIPLQYQSKLD